MPARLPLALRDVPFSKRLIPLESRAAPRGRRRVRCVRGFLPRRGSRGRRRPCVRRAGVSDDASASLVWFSRAWFSFRHPTPQAALARRRAAHAVRVVELAARKTTASRRRRRRWPILGRRFTTLRIRRRGRKPRVVPRVSGRGGCAVSSAGASPTEAAAAAGAAGASGAAAAPFKGSRAPARVGAGFSPFAVSWCAIDAMASAWTAASKAAEARAAASAAAAACAAARCRGELLSRGLQSDARVSAEGALC